MAEDTKTFKTDELIALMAGAELDPSGTRVANRQIIRHVCRLDEKASTAGFWELCVSLIRVQVPALAKVETLPLMIEREPAGVASEQAVEQKWLSDERKRLELPEEIEISSIPDTAPRAPNVVDLATARLDRLDRM